MSRLIGVAAVGALASCAPNEGRFLIKNAATEPIVHASVSICGQTERFEKIAPQQVKAGKYRVTSDSHYTVRIEFQSGRTLERDLGYVTNGVDFDDKLIVSDADITIIPEILN